MRHEGGGPLVFAVTLGRLTGRIGPRPPPTSSLGRHRYRPPAAASVCRRTRDLESPTCRAPPRPGWRLVPSTFGTRIHKARPDDCSSLRRTNRLRGRSCPQAHLRIPENRSVIAPIGASGAVGIGAHASTATTLAGHSVRVGPSGQHSSRIERPRKQGITTAARRGSSLGPRLDRFERRRQQPAPTSSIGRVGRCGFQRIAARLRGTATLRLAGVPAPDARRCHSPREEGGGSAAAASCWAARTSDGPMPCTTRTPMEIAPPGTALLEE